MNAATFRRLALALPDASEVPHMDRAAFRTPRRIFATLAADGRSANLRLDPEEQDALVGMRPDAFQAVPGGWGEQGWTVVTLAALGVADATAVLADAHARAVQKPERGKAAPRAKATKKKSAKAKPT
jgi:hypothetical protein